MSSMLHVASLQVTSICNSKTDDLQWQHFKLKSVMKVAEVKQITLSVLVIVVVNILVNPNVKVLYNLE
jgi:hypothetical protein